MTNLIGQFEFRYPKGARIRAKFNRPCTGFSITALFGPSGSGKTTVLRCLAGLERPQQGKIVFGDEVWFDSNESFHQTPWRRNVGYLFQEYALFPHLTVEENIGYGLRRQKPAERKRIVNDLLDRFELFGISASYPQQISGGQQQRTALARTLARRPALLLLDEPLAALDSTMQEETRLELRQKLVDFAIPMFIVTHDRNDAIGLADHLLVMNEGQILQSGKGETIFKYPANEIIAKMVGIKHLHKGRVAVRSTSTTTVIVGNVRLESKTTTNVKQDVLVCIRPEDVQLLPSPGTSDHYPNSFSATIRKITVEGAMHRLELDCGFAISAVAPLWMVSTFKFEIGAVVLVRIPSDAVHLI